MAGLFLLNDTVDKVCEFGIGGAALHLSIEIVIPYGEQAGADFSIGGDADPAAVPAEWVRNRGDDADFADAIVEAVAACGFGAGVRDLDQRAVFGHAREYFVEGDHDFRRPGAVFFEGHELDESQYDILFASEHAEWNDLVFIESAE